MIPKRLELCVLILVTNLTLIGCGGNSPTPLPDKITLYSIDGRQQAIKDAKKDAERFQGFPVLGKIVITNMRERRNIVDGLNKAIAHSPKSASGCFNPRHVLQWVENGKTRELIICFECSQYWEIVDGQDNGFHTIAGTL